MTNNIHGTTRRQAVAAAAMIVAGMAILSAKAEEISHSAESIHQETQYKASRKRIFDALMDTAQFDKIVRIALGMNGMSPGSAPTAINPEAGGTFTLFGGHIIGRQLELVPNERIVQAWRVVDWDPGIYSIARFELVEQGSGTKIVFDHTGFPQGKGEHLAAGWRAHYWGPLQKFLAGTSA
ncbi:MAG TPA: SRPBCC domain-containing protein [Acidobacteriaceae bacterium]